MPTRSVKMKSPGKPASQKPVGPRLPPAADNDDHQRLSQLSGPYASLRPRVEAMLAVASKGLAQMHDGSLFAHTLRAVGTRDGARVQMEGRSLRYTAMSALGIAQLDKRSQSQILGEHTIADFLKNAAFKAEDTPDLGSKALISWAMAETMSVVATPLYDALRARLKTNAPISTVECAWTLCAALAAGRLADMSDLVGAARTRLMSARHGSPLFAHMIPASASGLFRSHVGCFADQVYPIQALSRLHAAYGDPEAMTAAEACAERICALQGESGQWWWHYDIRCGTVMEGFPVYSVHQHAMGPMALLELREAGGRDFTPFIVRGLKWLDHHPETPRPLIDSEKNVIWRKVGRREPGKLVRKLAAASSRVLPGIQLPFADALFPPNRIDFECRPYEFGLMLYAWLSGGAVQKLVGQNRIAVARAPNGGGWNA